MINKILNKYLPLLAVLGLVLTSPTLLAAQKYTGFPVTKTRLLSVVKTRDVAIPIIVKLIKEQGVDFELTPQVEKELIAVKANRQIIDATRENYRQPAVARTQPKNTGVSTRNDVPATPSKEENTNEQYEQLISQSNQLSAQFNPNFTQQQLSNFALSVNKIGNQQIKLNPARFEGYRMVAFSFILAGNFNEAEKYGQMAIDRGGSLKFGVWHVVPGNVHLDILHVAKGLISIENLDGKFNPFYNSEVTGFQVYPNPINFQGTNIAGFSIATYKNNIQSRYDFAPFTTNSIEEANLIKRLVQANINR